MWKWRQQRLQDGTIVLLDNNLALIFKHVLHILVGGYWAVLYEKYLSEISVCASLAVSVCCAQRLARACLGVLQASHLDLVM